MATSFYVFGVNVEVSLHMPPVDPCVLPVHL